MNPVKITFQPKAAEKLVAMKVRTNAPDLSTVVYNACSVYQTLLGLTDKDFVWVEKGDKSIQIELFSSVQTEREGENK